MLDALEAGVITEVPEESGLNTDVVAALKAAAAWDLDDQWQWANTPPDERDDDPLWLAHLALAAHCRAVEAEQDTREQLMLLWVPTPEECIARILRILVAIANGELSSCPTDTGIDTDTADWLHQVATAVREHRFL